jgi:hypothetical protein
MAMGVVAPPCDANNNNGAIFFKRISKMTPYGKKTYTSHLSDVARVNQALKKREWKSLLSDEVKTWGQLRAAIGLTYDLDDDIEERLVLKYKSGRTKRDKNGVLKPIPAYIDDDSKTFLEGEVDDRGFELVARYNKGELREVDCSCDSEFMLSVMDDVGKAIREAYSSVPFDEVIYLFMDNAGGHGKKDVVKQYCKHLRDEYNIIIRHQQPRTPESNMLDLGIWMHLQSIVEEKHFGQRIHIGSLWNTMQAAWACISQQALTNVYERWLKVLDLIEEGEGSSHLVEKKRGRFFSAPSDEAEMVEGANDEEDEDADYWEEDNAEEDEDW